MTINGENLLQKGTSKLEATGIILAGGQSSRMKQNKAFLELTGQALIDRTLALFKEIFNEVIISSNERELYLNYHVPIIADNTPGLGPIGGIQAGLEAARYNTCFFVACDMPFLNPEVIIYMAQWKDSYDVIVPQGKKGLNPLHAFYSRSCLPYLERNIRQRKLRVIDLYDACRVRYIKEEELTAFGDPERFLCNVNTPEDWLRVSRQL